MLKLYINGVQYLGFTEFRCYKSIKDFCGSFEIITSSEYQKDYPLKVGDLVVCKINNIKILTGYVDITTKNIDASNNAISIKGRSKTADLVDSRLEGDLNNSKGLDLKIIIERILKKLGISDINVICNLGVLKVNSADVDNVGENCFDLIETLARKVNVLLTTDGDGNIEIVRAGTTKLDKILLLEKNNIESNVIKASCEWNNSERFNKYIVKAQDENSDNTSSAVDSDIRAGRQLVIFADATLTTSECRNRAVWEINNRKAMAFNYSCEVADFTYDGTNIFEVNKLIKVVDLVNDINNDLLIESCEYILDNNGYKTNLTLKSPLAYTLTNSSKKIGEKYAKA